MMRGPCIGLVLLLLLATLPALPAAPGGPGPADGASASPSSRAPFSWAAPRWVAGDNWRFHTLSYPNDTTTQNGGGLYTLTLTTTFISDNTTYNVQSGTIVEQSWTSYRSSVTGASHFQGTYTYTDIFGGNEVGCFDGTATATGTEYRRVSDVAFVGADLTIQESVNFWENCVVGTPSTNLCALGCPIAGSGTSDVTTNVPLAMAKFPLTDAGTWNVDTTVTTTVTPTGGTPDTHTTRYFFTSTASGPVNHTVEAGTFLAADLHEIGWKQKDADPQKTVDNHLFYAKDAKNRINLTQDGEHLNLFAVTFLPDLNWSAGSIAVDPPPMEGRSSNITALLVNLGDIDATGVPVKAFLGGTEVASGTAASVPAGGNASVTMAWTPATGSAGNKGLTVRADPGAVVTEYDEGNNELGLTITIVEPKPDLTLAASDIEVPAQVPIEDRSTVTATIHNDGTLDAAVFVVRFFDSWGTTERQIEGDKSLGPVPAGQSATLSVFWFPSALGAHTVRVEADPTSAVSEGNENNNEASTAVDVVQQDFAFTLTSPAPTRPVDPNATVDFRVDAKNTGKNPDTVAFATTVVGTGWTAALSVASTQLTSGSSLPLTVSITSPPEAPAGSKANVTVTGTSAGNTSYRRSISLEATVNRVAGADLRVLLSPEGKTARPGETVRYDFEITNTGNDADTFDLTVDSQKGWTTSIGGGASTGQLALKGTKKIGVETTVPGTGLAGEADIVTLTAKSQFDPARSFVGTVRTTVAQVHELSIGVTPRSDDVDPGKTKEFTLRLTNDGNGPEEVALNVSADPPVSWSIDVPPSERVLAGKTKDVPVGISVPKDGLAGDYDFTVEATGSDGATRSASFTLTVNQVHEGEVVLAVPTASVRAGRTVDLIVTVRNVGNGPDTLQLSLSGLPTKYLAAFNPPTVSLDPGESADVTLTINAPGSGDSVYPFTVTAKSADGSLATATGSLAVTPLAGASFAFGPILLLLAVVAAIGILGAAFAMRRSRAKQPVPPPPEIALTPPPAPPPTPPASPPES